MHDIVVVGAGPAGASFAKFAADRGFDVVVIDVLEFSRLWSKPCGDALGEDDLKGIPLKPPRGREVRQKVKGAEVFAPDYSFSIKVGGRGYIIDRTAMGQRVVREAVKSGAEFLDRTAFRNVIIEDGEVRGIVATRDGKKQEFRSHLVVDCTGDVALVKSRLPREWPVSEPVVHKILCFRGLVRVEDVGDPHIIRIYTDQVLAPNAYWWFFPEGGNMANVGLGVLPRDRAVLRKNYEKIISRFSVESRIQEAGAYVPVQSPPKSLVGPGVLVLGDAAPTVNPLTGGGLASSFSAASVAASKLGEVAEGGWDLTALWAMNGYLREGGAELAAMDVLKRALWRMDDKKIKRVMEALSDGSGIFGAFKTFIDPDLRGVVFMFREVKKHYREYPETPEGLKAWATKLEAFH